MLQPAGMVAAAVSDATIRRRISDRQWFAGGVDVSPVPANGRRRPHTA